MSHFDVAHIHEQGVDLIIVLVSSSFGHQGPSQQEETVAAIQACASAAGPRGAVVPVWNTGGRRMAFLAPTRWHSFFRSIDLGFVARNINRRLTCD